MSGERKEYQTDQYDIDYNFNNLHELLLFIPLEQLEKLKLTGSLESILQDISLDEILNFRKISLPNDARERLDRLIKAIPKSVKDEDKNSYYQYIIEQFAIDGIDMSELLTSDNIKNSTELQGISLQSQLNILQKGIIQEIDNQIRKKSKFTSLLKSDREKILDATTIVELESVLRMMQSHYMLGKFDISLFKNTKSIMYHMTQVKLDEIEKITAKTARNMTLVEK